MRATPSWRERPGCVPTERVKEREGLQPFFSCLTLQRAGRFTVSVVTFKSVARAFRSFFVATPAPATGAAEACDCTCCGETCCCPQCCCRGEDCGGCCCCKGKKTAYQTKSWLASAIALGMLLGFVSPAHADSIVLSPAEFATGEDFGQQDGIYDAFVLLGLGAVNNNGFTSVTTAMEFSPKVREACR